MHFVRYARKYSALLKTVPNQYPGCIQHVRFVTAFPVLPYTTSIADSNYDAIDGEEFTPASKNIPPVIPLGVYRKHVDKDILDILPNPRSQTRSPAAYFRIVKEETAKKIIEHISPYRKKDLPFIEINAGAGVLTKQLFQSDVSNLRVIESDEYYIQYLKGICASHKNTSLHFGSFLKMSYPNLEPNSAQYFNEILHNISKKDWCDDIVYQGFVATGTLQFIKAIISSVAHQRTWFQNGRAEFFVALTSNVCEALFGCCPTVKCRTVFNIFFEYEFLTVLDKNAFLPFWYQDRALTDMFLVKITPRKNLLNLCQAHELPTLCHFVNQVNRPGKVIAIETINWLTKKELSKKILLLPTNSAEPEVIGSSKKMPKSIQPCRDISSNRVDVNIFSRFCDLDPSQMLTVFTLLKESATFQETVGGHVCEQIWMDDIASEMIPTKKRMLRWPGRK